MSDIKTKHSDEQQTTPKRENVLEFQNATHEAKSRNDIRLSKTNLVLREGELAMLRLDRSQQTRRFSLLMQGLKVPTAGQVLFQEDDWQQMNLERQYRKRGRIGRVFVGQAWLENLNVTENVVLAKRHQGWTAESIMEEAAAWAKRFGIALTQRRPAFVEPSSLQIHQWIRAFLGKPALLILERPMLFVSAALLEKLTAAVEELRRTGTAVFWLASNQVEVDQSLTEPIFHYKTREGLLVPATEAASNE